MPDVDRRLGARMGTVDRWLSRIARHSARRTSRRSFLARLGGLLVGGAALPLLPVARAAAQSETPGPGQGGDPQSCDYWRYCAVDGFLSASCGGTHTSCPPGTEMSPVTWIGTCRNPEDGQDYLISYNDCCGKQVCGMSFCQRNEGDKPVYYTAKSNDINWCMGKVGVVYNSTVALSLGVATE